jgi:hypothetical protein
MKKSPSFKLLQTASYHLSPANFYVLLIQNTTQHGPPTVPLNVNIILQIVASTVNKYRCQWDIVINFIPLLLVNYLLSCKIGINDYCDYGTVYHLEKLLMAHCHIDSRPAHVNLQCRAKLTNTQLYKMQSGGK